MFDMSEPAAVAPPRSVKSPQGEGVYQSAWSDNYGWYTFGPGVHVVAFDGKLERSTSPATAAGMAAALNSAYLHGQVAK